LSAVETDYRFSGWLSGARSDVVFSRAKVTALLGLSARPQLTEQLKAKLLNNGEGYLMAGLTLAEMEHIDPIRCGAVLERVLIARPAAVISEFSGQDVDDATVDLLRKLIPLTTPVRENYLNVLEKLNMPGPQAMIRSAGGGTLSWMVFEFPSFLLRSEIFDVLESVFMQGWPIHPARPDYEMADIMDDVRAIALTLESNPKCENAFVAALTSSRDARDLAQITLGWREFASTLKLAGEISRRETSGDTL
jgi:hypothetical protein